MCQFVCDYLYCNLLTSSTYLMRTASTILIQAHLFGCNILIHCRSLLPQWFQLCQKLYFLYMHPLFQCRKQLCKSPQIACICCRKGNTLSTLICHIQCIIPIGIPQPHVVMFTHFIEGCQMLNQNMFQNAALHNIALCISLPASLCLIPVSILSCSSYDLCILEIRCLFQ